MCGCSHAHRRHTTKNPPRECANEGPGNEREREREGGGGKAIRMKCMNATEFNLQLNALIFLKVETGPGRRRNNAKWQRRAGVCVHPEKRQQGVGITRGMTSAPTSCAYTAGVLTGHESGADVTSVSRFASFLARGSKPEEHCSGSIAPVGCSPNVGSFRNARNTFGTREILGTEHKLFFRNTRHARRTFGAR